MTLPQEPLFLSPRFTETIWGGQALRQTFNKQLPAHVKIGESWEISALPVMETTVSRGMLQGESLRSLHEKYRTELMGSRNTESVVFPLLIKFIDARDALSVQVHPDDREAGLRYNAPSGKTECWYIAHAGTSARLCIGMKKTISRQELHHAINGGTLEEYLNTFPVSEGEFYFIPAGTVHAILGDVIVYEVQQSSDITLRMYDWQRKDASGNHRLLHIDDAVAVADIACGKIYTRTPLRVNDNNTFTHSIALFCRYFALEMYHLKQSTTVDLKPYDSLRIVTLLDGEGDLIWENGRAGIGKGTTVLLPASLPECSIHGIQGTRCISTFIPDIENDIYQPLLNAGVDRNTITQLGPE